VPPDAVKLTLLPGHKSVEPEGVIEAVGGTVTVTFCEVIAEQVPFVTVTVYVPELVILESVALVAPVDQR
jgi:hypothetical protein